MKNYAANNLINSKLTNLLGKSRKFQKLSTKKLIFTQSRLECPLVVRGGKFEILRKEKLFLIESKRKDFNLSRDLELIFYDYPVTDQTTESPLKSRWKGESSHRSRSFLEKFHPGRNKRDQMLEILCVASSRRSINFPVINKFFTWPKRNRTKSNAFVSELSLEDRKILSANDNPLLVCCIKVDVFVTENYKSSDYQLDNITVIRGPLK